MSEFNPYAAPEAEIVKPNLARHWRVLIALSTVFAWGMTFGLALAAAIMLAGRLGWLAWVPTIPLRF